MQPGLPVAAPHAFDGKQASSDGSAFACAVWGWRWSRPDSVDTSCLVFTESRMSKVRPLCRYCLVQRRSINFTICAQIYAQMVKSMPNQRLMSRCRVKAESSRLPLLTLIAIERCVGCASAVIHQGRQSTRCRRSLGRHEQPDCSGFRHPRQVISSRSGPRSRHRLFC